MARLKGSKYCNFRYRKDWCIQPWTLLCSPISIYINAFENPEEYACLQPFSITTHILNTCPTTSNKCFVSQSVLH